MKNRKTNLKVILIGNTNNELFRLGTSLSEIGFDITQILIQKGKLNDPEELRFQKRYKQSQVKIIDLRCFTEEEIISHDPKFINNISSLLQVFSFGIYDNVGPSFYKHFKIPHISYVTGSNLTYYANNNLSEFRTLSWPEEYKKSNDGVNKIKIYRKFVELQREGLASSKAIITFPEGVVPREDQFIKDIGISKLLRLTWTHFENFDLRKRFKINKRNIKVIFAARLDSKSFEQYGESERDSKGTEILIPAIHRINELNKDVKFTLFEKGKLFEKVKSELANLDLMKCTRFEKETNYQNFLRILNAHDIILDSIGDSPVGRVGIDGISASKCVGTNMTDEMFTKFFGSVFPNLFIPVNSANELINLVENFNYYKNTSGHSEFIEYVNKEQTKKIIETLEN